MKNEQLENGSTDELLETNSVNEEPKPEINKYRFSSSKFFGWFGLLLSVVSPMLGLACGFLGMSFAKPEEKEKVSVLCMIDMAIAAFMILQSITLQFILR